MKFQFAIAAIQSLTDLIWHDGKFLGITWTFWKILGWTGNAIFFSRFFTQWYATEKKRKVTIPVSFWWLSLIGSLLLLIYGLHKRDSVFIFGYAFTWIPYIRNLMIHHRDKNAARICVACRLESPPAVNFCPGCGNKFPASEVGKN